MIVTFILVSCESVKDNHTEKFDTFLNFPEPPIEIMSNVDDSSSEWDCSLINYFNIFQVKKNLYYLYYAAFGAESGSADINQGLFFAYSSDGKHWTRKKPNGENNTILRTGIQEQSVFMLKSDSSTPLGSLPM